MPEKDKGGKELGRLIAEHRLARRMEQTEVAQTLGVHSVTVSRWERGRVRISRAQLTQLESLFGLTPGELGGSATMHGAVSRETNSAKGSRSAPRPSAMGEESRVWIQRFVLKLTEAGVPEEEVDEARLLLTKSDVIAYAHGGSPAQGQLSEKDRLQVVKLIAASAIIPRLKGFG